MWSGGAAKPAPAHDPSSGQTFPWAEDSAFDLSLPFSVIVQCLDDRILHSSCGRPRFEILADTLFGYPKLFLLVGLFLLHDGQDHRISQLSVAAERLHLNGLCKRRRAVLASHGVIKRALLLFGKVGQLHRRAKGDPTVIHHVQNFRDEVGEADIALDLCIAIGRTISQQFA